MTEPTQTTATAAMLTRLSIPAELPEDILGAALAYADAGWYVLPIDQATKHAGSVLGKGWPAKSSRDAERIVDWFAGTDHGLALHVGRSGAVAFDVDHFNRLSPELAARLNQEYVPFQSTRAGDENRGHYLFAVPPGVMFGNSTGDLGKDWGEIRGANGIVVVQPTVHEKADAGGRYHWVRTGELPELPAELAARIPTPQTGADIAVSDADITAWIVQHTGGTQQSGLTPILNKYRADAAAGSRHNALIACLTWACKEAHAGLLSAPVAITSLLRLHKDALADPAHPNGADPRRSDFPGALAFAVGQARVNPYIDHTGHAGLPGRVVAAAAPPAPAAPPAANGHVNGGVDALVNGHLPPAPAPVALPRPAVYTEAGVAVALAELIHGSWNWCRDLGWMHWTGTHWESRELEHVMEVARVYLDQLRLVVKAEYDTAKQRDADEAALKILQAVVRSVHSLQTRAKCEAVTNFTKGQPTIVVDPKAFDTDPELLNCATGVINLRTGELLAHDPARLMRRITPVDYRPDAVHPDWQAALAAVVDDETRYWLRILFGSAATGYLFDEDLVAFNYGEGANGKSTVLGGVRFALGSYATLVMPKLLGGNGSDHETYMMSLLGARLAYLEELPRGHVLDVARIKQISGTAEITGRFMYRNPLSFKATHLLVVNTNYPPVVTDVDHGTWRRLLSIPWPFQFDSEQDGEHRKDKGLRARVHGGKVQQEAVLAWIVSGAKEWLTADRKAPPVPLACAAHTQEWRGDNDTLGTFLAKNTTTTKDWEGPLLVSELMERFNHAQPRGAAPWQMRTFVGRLRNHAFLLDRKLKVVKAKAAPHMDQLVIHNLGLTTQAPNWATDL